MTCNERLHNQVMKTGTFPVNRITPHLKENFNLLKVLVLFWKCCVCMFLSPFSCSPWRALKVRGADGLLHWGSAVSMENLGNPGTSLVRCDVLWYTQSLKVSTLWTNVKRAYFYSINLDCSLNITVFLFLTSFWRLIEMFGFPWRFVLVDCMKKPGSLEAHEKLFRWLKTPRKTMNPCLASFSSSWLLSL